MKKIISCYIISETSLGIQCAECLLEESHQLLGFISTHNETQQWAKAYNIPFFFSLEEFQKLNPYKTFDYLFSIANSQIIKKEILELPRYYSINYHDSPLPMYAGAYAPYWAIVNNEQTHGITWHIMNEIINGGNILKQITFPIETNETLATLNSKCNFYALNGLKKLIQELAKKPLLGKRQDFTKRSFYAFSQKHYLLSLSQSKKQQLIIEYHDAYVPYPQNKTIAELFEEQVTKTPNNVAAVYEGQELTYQQLNEKANRLAHYLRTLGVGPDILVAIAIERSLEMIISLLGILKAGGAYVPLDPSYPTKRLQFMLEDTNAPILITKSQLQKPLKETLFSYTGKLVPIDQIEDSLKEQNIENPLACSLPQHLAYIIYTSGSTGNPKGVMINHQGISNLTKAQEYLFQNNIYTKILQFASYSFDASAFENFYYPFKRSISIFNR